MQFTPKIATKIAERYKINLIPNFCLFHKSFPEKDFRALEHELTLRIDYWTFEFQNNKCK